MDSLVLEYSVIIMIVIMGFFAFLIGLQKMLQIIISSSFVMLMVLGRSAGLNWISYLVSQESSISLWGFSHTDIAYAIASADTTTSVIITIAILIYVVHYSRYMPSWSESFTSSRFSQLLFAPFAILSMVLCLIVAVLGGELFSTEFLIEIMEIYGRHSIIYTLIVWLPLGLIIQGLITLFLLFPPQRREIISSYDDI